jgi:hypothetical protein
VQRYVLREREWGGRYRGPTEWTAADGLRAAGRFVVVAGLRVGSDGD